MLETSLGVDMTVNGKSGVGGCCCPVSLSSGEAAIFVFTLPPYLVRAARAYRGRPRIADSGWRCTATGERSSARASNADSVRMAFPTWQGNECTAREQGRLRMQSRMDRRHHNVMTEIDEIAAPKVAPAAAPAARARHRLHRAEARGALSHLPGCHPSTYMTPSTIRVFCRVALS